MRTSKLHNMEYTFNYSKTEDVYKTNYCENLKLCTIDSICVDTMVNASVPLLRAYTVVMETFLRSVI